MRRFVIAATVAGALLAIGCSGMPHEMVGFGANFAPVVSDPGNIAYKVDLTMGRVESVRKAAAEYCAPREAIQKDNVNYYPDYQVMGYGLIRRISFKCAQPEKPRGIWNTFTGLDERTGESSYSVAAHSSTGHGTVAVGCTPTRGTMLLLRADTEKPVASMAFRIGTGTLYAATPKRENTYWVPRLPPNLIEDLTRADTLAVRATFTDGTASDFAANLNGFGKAYRGHVARKCR